MVFEIWLGEHWSHFGHGVAHMDDGSYKDLAAWVMTAMYGHDSVLVAEHDKFIEMDFPVRWKATENGLLFYDWDSLVKSIIFHNDSGRDLEISHLGFLSNGECREIRWEELCGRNK